MTLHAADAQTDLKSIIREQIEAFAKSIDQKDAANAAKKALASHGISGGGKKLSVGKNHALTATLWNSGLMKTAIISGCTKLIQFMQESGEDVLYSRLNLEWYSTDFVHRHWTFLNPKDMEGGGWYDRGFAYRESFLPKEKVNAYDHSLVGIFGGGFVDVSIKCAEVKNREIIYDVSAMAWDRFDFKTSGSGGFKDFISGIGALLFREFDWESKVTFQLTVPNECEHSYQTKTTKPTCTAKGYTTYTCTLCGCSYKADDTAKKPHTYENEEDASCNLCGALRAVRGDMNADFKKDAQDALYLLRHVLMPKVYPTAQSADINGDGRTDSMDALYLLRHILLPKEYPLK